MLSTVVVLFAAVVKLPLKVALATSAEPSVSVPLFVRVPSARRVCPPAPVRVKVAPWAMVDVVDSLSVFFTMPVKLASLPVFILPAMTASLCSPFTRAVREYKPVSSMPSMMTSPEPPTRFAHSAFSCKTAPAVFFMLSNSKPLRRSCPSLVTVPTMLVPFVNPPSWVMVPKSSASAFTTASAAMVTVPPALTLKSPPVTSSVPAFTLSAPSTTVLPATVTLETVVVTPVAPVVKAPLKLALSVLATLPRVRAPLFIRLPASRSACPPAPVRVNVAPWAMVDVVDCVSVLAMMPVKLASLPVFILPAMTASLCSPFTRAVREYKPVSSTPSNSTFPVPPTRLVQSVFSCKTTFAAFVMEVKPRPLKRSSPSFVTVPSMSVPFVKEPSAPMVPKSSASALRVASAAIFT